MRTPHWFATLHRLVSALPGLVSERLELLALELHRAGRAIARIVALVVVAAILAITAWLALWACLALVLVASGWSWPLAMLAVLLVNLLLTGAALAWIRSLVATVGLPATRRHLVFGAGAETTADAHPSAQPFANP